MSTQESASTESMQQADLADRPTPDQLRPLRDLISDFDGIAPLAIPYTRLPPRWGLYADQFRCWADLAEHSPQSLLALPKVGLSAVHALMEVADDAVAACHASAGAELVAPAAAVSALVGRLTDLDREILSARVWAPHPQRQRDLAQRLGVNPVSVQRHQPRALERFTELLADPVHRAVGEHATALRARLGPYLPQKMATAQLHSLGIEPDSQAAQVLLYVAGPYAARGEWVENTTARGQARAAASVDALFTSCPAPTPALVVDSLTTLGMPDEAAQAYLGKHLPLRHFGDVCVWWRGDTAANMAEGVLQGLGSPATAEAIYALIDPGVTTLTTFNGTLSKDYRFVRASRRTWGLRAWGITEYVGIASAIRSLLDARGGQAGVAHVLAAMAARYPDVAETSVRSYLASLEFVTDAGTVRRRRRDDPWPPVAPLNTARGAFRHGDNEIRLALIVTEDLLRGSGLALNIAVAHALGVQPGQRVSFAGPHGGAAVSWRLSSTSGAALSSLRSHAQAAGADRGEILVLEFTVTPRAFRVTRLDPHLSETAGLATLLGHTIGDLDTDLAASLECAPDEVVAVLANRGDDELARLVENWRHV